jgi:hypothetical protein
MSPGSRAEYGGVFIKMPAFIINVRKPVASFEKQNVFENSKGISGLPGLKI